VLLARRRRAPGAVHGVGVGVEIVLGQLTDDETLGAELGQAHVGVLSNGGFRSGE
jgi:hypothetical protein